MLYNTSTMKCTPTLPACTREPNLPVYTHVEPLPNFENTTTCTSLCSMLSYLPDEREGSCGMHMRFMRSVCGVRFQTILNK